MLNDPTTLQATTDQDAVNVWLRARANRSSHTLDSYQRESRRLLLWLEEMRLSMATMTVEHVDLFLNHLENPPAHWLRPRHAADDEILLPTQTLFAGLSKQSLRQTRTILGQLFNYLQDAGYLQRNVVKLAARNNVIVREVSNRSLDLDSWLYLWDWIKSIHARTTKEVKTAQRARWVFALFYHTGMRLDEVARGKMQDFIRLDGLWYLKTVGKGSRERMITVNSELLSELREYRESIGLSSLPTVLEDEPLVRSFVTSKNGQRDLTSRSIASITTTIAERAAGDCDDDQMRRQISKMTAHWMRHTNATHRLLAGASLETTQDELGHQDPKTTRIYAKTTSQKRRNDAELLANLRRNDGD